MGYFDTVKEAEAGRKAKATMEAESLGLEYADKAIASQQDNEDRKLAIKQMAGKAVAKGYDAGKQEGKQELFNNLGALNQASGGLALNPQVQEKIGQEMVMGKAAQIVEQLDRAQEQGAPTEELSRVFENLTPQLKQAVQSIKTQKMQNQQDELNAVRQVGALQGNQMEQRVETPVPVQTPGSAFERSKSPINGRMEQILQETAQIGQREPQQ